jgi:O-Antigen ligase
MEEAPRSVADRVGLGALIALPAALTVYFAFDGGGYHVGSPAIGVLVLIWALLARTTLAERPFAGFSWPLAVAVCAGSAFALLTLASAIWSDSLARALPEFDRALLYVLALVLFGSLPRRSSRLRWMVRALALAIVVVCATALASRLFPDVITISGSVADNRLSFPVSYWNALGLMATLGIVLCLHLASSTREHLPVRAVAAAAVPLLASTLYFTFSRGAIVACIVGVLAYIGLGRPRGLAGGVLATVPTTIIALVAAYHADQLATLNPTTSKAASQGHKVALVLILCVAAAGVGRVLLLPLDARLARIRVAPETRRRAAIGAVATVVVAAAILIPALGVPSEIGHQWDRFASGKSPTANGDLRTRLSDPANNGRTQHWRVAVQGYREAKLGGQGAGTYQLTWQQRRHIDTSVRDGHSLYIEVLDELGIAGLLLVVALVGSVLVGIAARMRKENRSLYAAIFAAGLAWALQAGVDWMWEMPAVTFWFFALGGATLAARESARAETVAHAGRNNAIVALGWMALAVTPVLLALSQHQYDNMTRAFVNGDCTTATSKARSAISTLSVRPEPYEILGYCDLDRGSSVQAVDALRKAVKRDPDYWEYHYGLATAQGAAGLDPRPAARQAWRENPRESLTKDLVRFFRTGNSAGWKRGAVKARADILDSSVLAVR